MSERPVIAVTGKIRHYFYAYFYEDRYQYCLSPAD